jgi:hypothetical protein
MISAALTTMTSGQSKDPLIHALLRTLHNGMDQPSHSSIRIALVGASSRQSSDASLSGGISFHA